MLEKNRPNLRQEKGTNTRVKSRAGAPHNGGGIEVPGSFLTNGRQGHMVADVHHKIGNQR